MKKNITLRALAIALLCAMALPSLAACRDGLPTDSAGTESTTVSDTAPEGSDTSVAESSSTAETTAVTAAVTTAAPVTVAPPASSPEAIPGAVNLIGAIRVSTRSAESLDGGIYSISATKGSKTNIDFKYDPLSAAEYDDAFIGFYVKYSEVPGILRNYVLSNVPVGADEHAGVKFGGYVVRAEEVDARPGEWIWMQLPLSVYESFTSGGCYCTLGGNKKHDVSAPLNHKALCGFQFQIDDTVGEGAKADITAQFKDIGIYTYQATASSVVSLPAGCSPLSAGVTLTDYAAVDGVYTVHATQKVKTNLSFTMTPTDTRSYSDAFIGFHILYSDFPAYLRAYVYGTVTVDGVTHDNVRFGDTTLRRENLGLTDGKWGWVQIPLSLFDKLKGSCSCAAGGGKKHTVTPFSAESIFSFQLQIDDMSNPLLTGDTQLQLMNVGLYTYQASPTFRYTGDSVPAAFMLSRNLSSTASGVSAAEIGYTLSAPGGKVTAFPFSFDRADMTVRDDAFIGFLYRANRATPLTVGLIGDAGGKSGLHFTGYTVAPAATQNAEAWRWVEIPLSSLGNLSAEGVALNAKALSGITLSVDAGSANNDVKTEIRYLGIYSYKAAEEIATVTPAPAGSNISADYTWDHILMGCYGFVNGMVMHPKDPNLLYAWTDVGGMYRWDAEARQWIQLMEVLGLELTGLKSVRSVALDPTDTNVVYVACGGNTDMTDIIKSTDQGKSWTLTGFSEKMAVDGKKILCGNTTVAKAVGDALVIDPNNTKVMYFGTQENGFYRSDDGGENWIKISAIPDTGWPIGGVANVYINPAKKNESRSTDVYVSVWGHGIYKSTDGGLTFALIEGSPRCPGQVQVITRDGKERMYVTSLNPVYVQYYTGKSDVGKVETDEGGSFYMYEDGKWTDLHPARGTSEHAWFLEQTSFSSFLIDSRNPDLIMLNTSPWNVRGSYLWRSTDGGITFERVSQTYQASRFIQDPLNSDGMWIPYGGGIRYVENFVTMTNKEQFLDRSTGVETICATTMASLPGTKDAPILLIMAQDHSIRVQEELRVQAPDNATEPKFNHGGGVDFCESDPTYVVRAGVKGRHNEGEGSLAYSTDSGRTFTAMNWDSTMRVVDCAVGAAKLESGFPVVMAVSVGRSNDRADGSGVYRSRDGGVTWDYMTAIPSTRTKASNEYNNHLLASDRVNPQVFYYIEGQNLYRTADGGDSWEKLSVSIDGKTVKVDGGRNSIKCVPCKEGHVWVKGEKGAIYTSADFGESWTALSGIEAAISHSCSFGFGIGKDPAGDPAIYVTGYVNGDLGCYISDDMGRSWTKISPDSQKFFAGIVDVTGDRRVYGRVFIGTGGNGVLYAQLDR